ncbi:MAG: hypothetical protein ACK5AR_11450 [Flavobacteriia bacterium]
MKHKEQLLKWVLFIVLFWNCAMALTSSLDFYLKVLLALSSLSPLLIFIITIGFKIALLILAVKIAVKLLDKFQESKQLLLVGLAVYFGILFIDYLSSSLVTQMVMQHAGPRLESYNFFLASNTSLMYVSSFLQPFVLVVFGLITYFREPWPEK